MPSLPRNLNIFSNYFQQYSISKHMITQQKFTHFTSITGFKLWSSVCYSLNFTVISWRRKKKKSSTQHIKLESFSQKNMKKDNYNHFSPPKVLQNLKLVQTEVEMTINNLLKRKELFTCMEIHTSKLICLHYRTYTNPFISYCCNYML